jgi:hypothetical protein
MDDSWASVSSLVNAVNPIQYLSRIPGVPRRISDAKGWLEWDLGTPDLKSGGE